MHALAITLASLMLGTDTVQAETTQPSAVEESVDTTAADESGGAPHGRARRIHRRAERRESFAEADWEFSLSAYTYIVPEDHDYVQPTITVDRDWLHLEARYNYEDLETGSLFAGYNFAFGDELALEVTPIIGAVFGDTNGVAPGYEISLSYKRFELYTEGEYLFDTDESSDSFFYTWSEITYSFTDWMRAGIVIQRTKAYETDLDIQRGVLLGFSYKQVDFAAYLLNLGWDEPTFVFSLGISF